MRWLRFSFVQATKAGDRIAWHLLAVLLLCTVVHPSVQKPKTLLLRLGVCSHAPSVTRPRPRTARLPTLVGSHAAGYVHV